MTGRVLVTGGAGRIGRYLAAGLPAYGWRVRGFDLPGTGPTEGELVHGSVLDPAALASALDGVDAVIHLAGIATEADLPSLVEANILGAHAVLEASRRAGVTRVMTASSNHAIGFAPAEAVVADGLPPRPDSLYGVTKVAVEALASLYADKHGMTVVAPRIGTCTDAPHTPRHLGSWLSPDDMVRFAVAFLEGEASGFSAPLVVSANTRRTWSLEVAGRMGYRPRDDAEAFAARIPADRGASDPDSASFRYVGGSFTL